MSQKVDSTKMSRKSKPKRITGVNLTRLTPVFSCPSCDYAGACISTKVNGHLNSLGEVAPSTIVWSYKTFAVCLFCGYRGMLEDFDIEQQEVKS